MSADTTTIIGLDLGQSQDYTALALVERRLPEAGAGEGRREASYFVRKLERTRGTPYPEVISRVITIFNRSSKQITLVVDQTGVGAPVVDSFRQAGLKPTGIAIHGGDKVTNEGSTYRVPKRDLMSGLQVLLQNGRLKVSKKLALAEVLVQEILNMRLKIDPLTAHDSYSAWREAEHDDLVLATAMACWYGEHVWRRKYTAADMGSGRPPVIGGMEPYRW